MMDDKIIQIVKENFPNWQGIILIDTKGDQHIASAPGSPFEKKDGEFELTRIASFASIRYNIADFDKLLNGLEVTINVFGNTLMQVTSADHEIFAVLISRNENITESYQTFRKVVNAVKNLRS